MYRAIENVGHGFLFPQPKEDMEENTEEITIKSFFNRDIEKNYEQKLAVSYIFYFLSCYENADNFIIGVAYSMSSLIAQ